MWDCSFCHGYLNQFKFVWPLFVSATPLVLFLFVLSCDPPLVHSSSNKEWHATISMRTLSLIYLQLHRGSFLFNRAGADGRSEEEGEGGEEVEGGGMSEPRGYRTTGERREEWLLGSRDSHWKEVWLAQSAVDVCGWKLLSWAGWLQKDFTSRRETSTLKSCDILLKAPSDLEVNCWDSWEGWDALLTDLEFLKVLKCDWGPELKRSPLNLTFLADLVSDWLTCCLIGWVWVLEPWLTGWRFTWSAGWRCVCHLNDRVIDQKGLSWLGSGWAEPGTWSVKDGWENRPQRRSSGVTWVLHFSFLKKSPKIY